MLLLPLPSPPAASVPLLLLLLTPLLFLNHAERADSFLLPPREGPKPSQRHRRDDAAPAAAAAHAAAADAYAAHWEDLLNSEHRESADELRERRRTWSRARLERSGSSVLDAAAVPDTELFGEKIVRVTRGGLGLGGGFGFFGGGSTGASGGGAAPPPPRLRDRFSRGDVLILSPEDRSPKPYRFVPRECCVVDVGTDWMTVGVGPNWPAGLWESRRRPPGSYAVRLDRAAPRAPLLAQRKSLQLTRNGRAGEAAELLAATYRVSDDGAGGGGGGGGWDLESYARASGAPSRFDRGACVGTDKDGGGGPAPGGGPSEQRQNQQPRLEGAIKEAIAEAKRDAYPMFEPNPSQEEAIAWALGRRVSLVRGPPGTGKTRVAALLISAAMRLRGVDASPSPGTTSASAADAPTAPPPPPPPPRVLAVAHSNGAADVLLEALLAIGVPAVRAGRPASVSPAVRHRTVVAMADTHPEVVSLRAAARNVTLPAHLQSSALVEARRCAHEICGMIADAAPVVVASCIGAHQLLREDGPSSSSSSSSSGGGDDGGAAPSFPIVVLDEAAQTTEPALVCALAAARAEQVVLVGDTRQLPPTVASEDPTLRYRLGLSPMARLEADGIDERTLRVQYRMTPALLEHPSRYFYDGLVACADDGDDNDGGSPSATSARPPPGGFPWPDGLPLAFVNVGGDLEVTHNFGGKSNPVEAGLVADIVSSLLDAGDVDSRNVAVISPYSRQVDRIRTELAAPVLGRNSAAAGRTVRVGTVDSFQGQETDVVVFSAVRSNSLSELGFLRDPRRLCVTITRARRGLVLVGDERVLRTSRHWAALLDSCQSRGCTVDAGELSTNITGSLREESTFGTVNRAEEGTRMSASESVEDLLDALTSSTIDL